MNLCAFSSIVANCISALLVVRSTRVPKLGSQANFDNAKILKVPGTQCCPLKRGKTISGLPCSLASVISDNCILTHCFCRERLKKERKEEEKKYLAKRIYMDFLRCSSFLIYVVFIFVSWWWLLFTVQFSMSFHLRSSEVVFTAPKKTQSIWCALQVWRKWLTTLIRLQAFIVITFFSLSKCKQLNF